MHSDVCGPMRHASLGGARYLVTFIDNESRWCEVFMIEQKSDVLNAFKTYKAAAETFTGRKIKMLQSDNGREYCSNEFSEFLRKHGIKRRLMVPHTPQQNGVAERKNRTLVEMARCMMRHAAVPPIFWAEAINTANYIRNRCITKSLNRRVPYTAWTGKKPTLIHLKIFGTKAYALNKVPKREKFDSRSQECMLVGYSTESKAYRLWSPKSRKVIVSRDVKFVDEMCYKNKYEKFFDEGETLNDPDGLVDIEIASPTVKKGLRDPNQREEATREIRVSPPRNRVRESRKRLASYGTAVGQAKRGLCPEECSVSLHRIRTRKNRESQTMITTTSLMTLMRSTR